MNLLPQTCFRFIVLCFLLGFSKDYSSAQAPDHFGFNYTLEIGYRYLQPSMKNQSYQLLDPISHTCKGGYGILTSGLVTRTFGNWLFNARLELNYNRISDVVLVNENGLNTEFAVSYDLFMSMPEIGFGRCFKFKNGINSSLELGIGYAFLINKEGDIGSLKVYDVLNDRHDYYEYRSAYSSINPITARFGAKLYFPLKKNRVGFGISALLSNAIICDFELQKVNGFSYDHLGETENYLFFRTFCLSIGYNFGYK
jgi:hypothetical protein